MDALWVVVSDRHEARIFETNSPGAKLKRVVDLESPEARERAQNLVSDRPGRVASSASSEIRHGLGSEDRRKKVKAGKFAKEVANLLKQEFHRNRFDTLVLIAEPAFLGYLRKGLPKDVQGRIAVSVDKDFSHVSDENMSLHLKDTLSEIFRDPRYWTHRPVAS